MKRVLAALLVMCVFPFSSSAQDNAINPFLDAFVKNFERSSNLSTKIELLQDAADLDQLGMGQIYVMAIEYVLNNIEQMETDPLAVELATLAVRLIASINYADANEIMWRMFSGTSNTTVRIEILNTLGTTAKDSPDIADAIAVWVDSQNLAYSDARAVDLAVFSEGITALGKLGRETAFPVLFSASLAGYPHDIRTKITGALARFEGDVSEHLIQVMNESPVSDKLAALDLAGQMDTLGDKNLAEIAMAALSYGNETLVNSFEEQKKITELRAKAASILARLSWAEATDLMIKHFDISISEYENGVAEKSVLLDAIAGLGIMGNHEAAVRLTLYIEVLNFNMENGHSPDEQIILAVVNNLGKLGDRVALDSLLYVKYLEYSNAVKKAAREAQKNLKIR
ncbi:MAG: hypothetical protein JW874_04935 [Spirochaetales bacterium]|nr:hypothetical protein [Spirochaetales bacterium]